MLPDICDVWLRASGRQADRGTRPHCGEGIPSSAAGFAHIGIIALVDEATGYQYKHPAATLKST